MSDIGVAIIKFTTFINVCVCVCANRTRTKKAVYIAKKESSSSRVNM